LQKEIIISEAFFPLKLPDSLHRVYLQREHKTVTSLSPTPQLEWDFFCRTWEEFGEKETDKMDTR
jgi:hypothetical protein